MRARTHDYRVNPKSEWLGGKRLLSTAQSAICVREVIFSLERMRGDMRFNRFDRDEQLVSDLLVGFAQRNLLGDLCLAPGQLGVGGA